jgi:hypothetical protein
MAYASLSELRSVLQSGGNTLPTTDDALLTMYLADAQQLIDEFCHRTFEASATTTRRFDAIADVRERGADGSWAYSGAGRTLWLGDDLATTTSLTVTNGDGTAVSSSDYVLEPRNEAPYYAITLKSGSSVTWTYDDSPENAIAVTGYWAYSQTADALIRGATLALAAWCYRQRSTNSDTDRPLLTGDGVTILPAVLPKNVYERLAARRRLV